MRNLAGLATRSVVRNRRRYVLTAVGASLGVAVLFAVVVTSGASRDALDRSVRGQTGRADVVISPTGAFDALLPPGTAEAVRQLDGVDAVVPGLGMRTTLETGDRSGTGDPRDRIVFLVGIDPAEYRTLHDLRTDDGRDPSDGAAEVLVPRRLAASRGVAVGDEVTMVAPSGRVSATVVGVLADVGAATAHQGDVLYTTIPTVRGFVGAPADAIGGLDVDLAAGVDTQEWIRANRSELAGVSVSSAADLAAGFRSFIDGINSALTLVAAIAVFVGGFLVFLTFSVAVAERTRVLGTLRALGAVQRRVARVVVAEAAVLGAVCAVVGLVVGYGLSSVAVGLVGGLLDLDLGGVGLPIGAAVLSAGLGIGVSVAAAWVPARRAARTDPVSAMRGGAMAIERPPVRWIGPALLLVGVGLATLSESILVGAAGALALLGGAVLTVPLAIVPLGRLAGRAIDRLAPGPGAIAARHLDRERSRSAYTLALVMVVLAAVLAVAASNLALGRSLDDILDHQARSVQVFAPGAIGDEAIEEIAAVEGVATVSPVRFGNAELSIPLPDGAAVSGTNGPGRRSTFLQVIDPSTYFDVAGFPYVDGDDRSVQPALAEGGSVVLPSPEANRLGVEVGDDVHLTVRDGVARFRVAGIYSVLGGGFGVVVGAADLDTVGAGRVNGVLLGTDGTDPEVVAGRLRSTVAADRQLTVDTPADTRAFARGQLDGFFSLAYAILTLTAVISMLGLANTLVVAVIARTREIGVLRSHGARRRQVRRMVTVEAAIMTFIALVLALPLTALLGLGLVAGQRATLGADASYRFPWSFVLPVGVAAIVLAALAASIPARRASRLEIVETLRFE